MTKVTVISEPRHRACPLCQSLCKRLKIPPPLSASHSPISGEGPFTDSHPTKMEMEAQEGKELPEAQQLAGAGVRTEPTVWWGVIPDQMRGSRSRQPF